MNTSEKIASVVAQFIAADREEDRNRIAELERDNNAVVQCCGELRQSIDVYLAEIQRLTEKCAALAVENKRLSEYASGNWVDVVETPAVKRAPKVGDKVRAKMSGRIGVVFKCFESVALVDQGGVMFEVLTSELEVIE